MTRPAVAILARAPASGGKTRLAPHFPASRLLDLRRALLVDTITVVRAVDATPFVFFTPDDGRAEIAAMAPGFALVPQRGADLGSRMQHALAHLLDERGFASAVLVGSDAPLLTEGDLVAAVASLRNQPVVIGPAEDGGYYLIGMRGLHAALFDAVPWGSSAVLQTTLARAKRLAIDTHLLRHVYDIDTIEDLCRVEQDLIALPRDVAPNLRAWFKR